MGNSFISGFLSSFFHHFCSLSIQRGIHIVFTYENELPPPPQWKMRFWLKTMEHEKSFICLIIILLGLQTFHSYFSSLYLSISYSYTSSFGQGVDYAIMTGGDVAPL
jgi:hypothetical protein